MSRVYSAPPNPKPMTNDCKSKFVICLQSKALVLQSHGDCKITYRKTTGESSPVIQGCLSLGGISYLCVTLFLSSLPTFVLGGLWLSDVLKTVLLTLEVEIGAIANTFDCMDFSTHPTESYCFSAEPVIHWG